MSEEAYFNADGSRDLRFNGRNRANDAWRLFLTIKEFANEEVRIIAADSPISSLNDHTLVTAKWVNEKNFAKDSSVVHLSGNETISDKKTFTYPISVAASTGFEVVRTDQDLKTIPSSDVQTWYGRYKDKNNLSGLLIKHYQRESGETSVSLTDINYYHTDDNNGDWSSLTIGHNPDGTRYIKAFYDPIDSINEYEVITAKWLRKYIWNPDGAQVVHTVNDESISGVKTFTRSISVSANPLIQSSHWTGISVFDSTRSNGSQKILAQVLDKDGKRFISLEVSANTDGGRTLHINGRNREDSWWTTLAKFTEKGDGTIVGELGGSPVTDSNDNSIATTGWVNERIQENVPDFGDWESLEASGTASKSGIFVVISKTNTTVEIYVDEILRAHTVRRDSYGQGKTSITCPVRKGSTYRINGAETISFIPLV